MKRTRKSNQVKLFSSDDYSAKKFGQGFQHHRQTNESIDLPPGFEHNYFLNHSRPKFSRISQIKWECPPSFALSSHWQVAAGEESGEKEVQRLREMRVLEALYPRISNIPPSPCVSFYAEVEDYNDSDTPPIPLTPIEEREFVSEVVASSQNLHQYSSNANLETTFVVEAAITKINEQGNLIDRELLIKILIDPIMIEQILLSQRRMPLPATTANATPYQPNTGSSSTSYGIENGKYYKKFKGQHDGDKQVSMDSMKSGHNKQGEVKQIINKSCRFFKTKRGCRNGNNCLYKHDGSVQIRCGNVQKDQNAKRKNKL